MGISLFLTMHALVILCFFVMLCFFQNGYNGIKTPVAQDSKYFVPTFLKLTKLLKVINSYQV